MAALAAGLAGSDALAAVFFAGVLLAALAAGLAEAGVFFVAAFFASFEGAAALAAAFLEDVATLAVLLRVPTILLRND